MLEDGYEADATVDGVAEPGVGLVGQRIDGVLALGGVEFVEDFGHVAGAEHLVDVGEFLRLVWREVGCEYAFLGAFSTEELAGRARGV